MNWPLTASAFVIGILIGFIGRNFVQVNFKPDFDIVDICSIAVTVLVAFLLQNYIAQKFSNSRAEKDLLLEEARGWLKTCRETRRVINASHDKRTLTSDDFYNRPLAKVVKD